MASNSLLTLKSDGKTNISKSRNMLLKIELNIESEVVKKLLSIYTENGKVKEMFDINKYKNIYPKKL